MNKEDDFGDSEFGEAEDLVLNILATSARWLVADPDAERFIARLADQGPRLFPALLTQDADAAAPRGGLADGEQAVQAARFFRSFGWAIASAMPLPSQGFKARKLPTPGRNEPCLCGSMRKFKHCCAGLIAHVPPLDASILSALVLDALPRKAWAGLPQSPIEAQQITEAAEYLAGEGRFDDARRLLEPWSKLPAPWPDARAELLELLGEMYFELGNPRKRRQLAQDMVTHGATRVRSKGWQRLSMLACDAGDADAAHAALQNAQRLAPDDPNVALIEVTILSALGEETRARERAAFHAKRLARLPEAAALADAITSLTELADPASELSARMRAMQGGEDTPDPLAALERWFETLPAPKLRLSLPVKPCTDLGELRATAAFGKSLDRWRRVVGPVMEALGGDADPLPPLSALAELRALLQADPGLADDFEVLDDLLTILDVLSAASTGGVELRAMMRAMQLWELLRTRQPGAACEWGYVGNRPALRLLARRIQLDGSPTAESSFDWLTHLVEVLNPNDNFGLRQRLAEAYLRRGDCAAALRLCERYPDDFVGMSLLHARSLLAERRLAQAVQKLQQALAQNVHVRPLLIASRAPRVPDVPSYALGSKEEACIALASQFDLWRGDPAVRKWVTQQVQAQSAPGGTTAGLFDDE